MSQELWPDSEGPIMESGTELNKLKWTEVLVPKLKGFLSFYTQTWLGIVFNLSYSSKTKPKNKQTTPATFWFPLTDCPCAQNSWPFSQMPLLDTPYSSVYSLPPSYPHPLPIRFSLKFHMLRCFFFFSSSYSIEHTHAPQRDLCEKTGHVTLSAWDCEITFLGTSVCHQEGYYRTNSETLEKEITISSSKQYLPKA